MARMANRARLTRPEVEILRRSVGASGQLPRDQLDRLLEETAILLEERKQLARLFDDLSPLWRDVRGTLNELHRLLSQPSQPPR